MATDAEASVGGYVGRDGSKDCDDGFVDEDDLFNELENEDIPASIREARMNQLKQQVAAAKEIEEKGLGLYSDIEKEEEVLKMTTTIPKVIIHFQKPDFRMCCIMDKHLKILAEQYRDVKICKVNVEIVPFFVTKLQIQVLPAVLLFLDGVVVDRVVGFEELGNTDSFTTAALEKRIAKSGIIKIQGLNNPTNKTIFGFDRRRGDEDSSDEDM